jgi:transcription initiation factor TFIIIB Brf1 subunit/transcription initiation factor TFIIB
MSAAASPLLRQVARALARREQAKADLLAAVRLAREEHTLQEIASVLGVSRQFVHELTQKEEK